ncbi:hypothetical protein MUK70_11710 [Dyadobacter chenwenxiniae]|uniref:Uncharacterized protein n=1 Tax=Dyadobacter chenwenxiniae TaxID=2906456 RepID=A0A9X1TCC0_9BACT|nr:hypothetical protein [Dyadobacter chenwenxiniae]MCF0059907.1 hypothetical protein [Dyadobacter chenwenxiniae]UON85646.1 hypothetical protein MUK70_11710 [Dyadobacter chenwenxiniae]
MEEKFIYICKIKLIGSPFAVFDESMAKSWVDQDPDAHYYEKVPILYEF